MKLFCLISAYWIFAWLINPGPALACKDCFYESEAYLSRISQLKSPNREIALALWFGAYSKVPDEKKTGLKRTLTYPWRANKLLLSDPVIIQYLEIWNKYLPHAPIANEGRNLLRDNISNTKVLEIPLLSLENEIFVHVYFTNQINPFGPIFKYKSISFQSAALEDVPNEIQMRQYAVCLKDIGGQLESGWGLNFQIPPRLIANRVINPVAGKCYSLKIEERELKKHTLKCGNDIEGVVLHLKGKQKRIPSKPEVNFKKNQVTTVLKISP